MRSTDSLSFSIKEELAWNEFIPRRGNKSFFLQFARQENLFMKATYQWNSARSSCLSEMPVLRAREVNAVPPKPSVPAAGLGSSLCGGDEHGASDMGWLQ
jgi:hypothetical protein